MKRLVVVATSAALLLSLGLGCGDDAAPLEDAGVDVIHDDFQVPVDMNPNLDAPPPSDADMGVLPDIGVTDTNCSATVSAINGTPATQKTKLSSLDDQDKALADIQIAVEVTVIGKPDGTDVALAVPGLTPKPTAKTVAGKATFTKVTVSPKLLSGSIKAEIAGCGGDMWLFNMVQDPTCSITQPQNGTTLYPKDDAFPGTPQFEYTVRVATNAPPGTDVELSVDGTSQGVKQTGSVGQASFANLVLGSGGVIALEGKVTVPVEGTQKLEATCSSTVQLDIGAPSCKLNLWDPAPKPITGGQGLGPAQDADTSTPGLQTNLTVDTEAGVDEVELTITAPGQTPVTYKATTANGLLANLTATYTKIDVKEGKNVTAEAVCKNTALGKKGFSAKQVATVDITPPPTIQAKSSTALGGLECKVTQNRKGEITCTFTALSDGAQGSGIEKYLFNYRKNSDIDASNFDAIDTVASEKLALQPGTPQSIKVTGLTMPDTFDFAIKAVDYLGNVADISEDVPALKVDFVVQHIVGQAANNYYGNSMAVGDFNCDGLTDIAVGQPGANSLVGEVHLFFSSGASLPSTPSKIIRGTTTSAEKSSQFGVRIAALDYNGDNCSDLVVAANTSASQQGKLLLYLGTSLWIDRDDYSTGKGAEVVWQLPATSTSTERLGARIAALDINGDGLGDLAMTHWSTAAPQWADVLVRYGETTVTPMGPSVSPTVREATVDANLRLTGGQLGNWFAFKLRRGGLLNSDTYEELLIAAPKTPQTGTGMGAAYVLLGAASTTPGSQTTLDLTTSQRVVRIDGDANSVAFGGSLDGVGDVNGDGVAEFVISDTDLTVNSVSKAGQAYMFNFSASTPTSITDAVAVLENDVPTTDGVYGKSISPGASVHNLKGADLNGDGYADFIVGVSRSTSQDYGSAALFMGATGQLANIKRSSADYVFSPGTDGTIAYASSVVFAGDTNGDSFADVVIADTWYPTSAGAKVGRISIYR